jgi:cytochrome oxidase Cu insertion factor (SCO1/SenC/PrrC family)
MSDTVDKASLRSQRIKLLVILGIFALPVIVASLWHANSDNWRPADTTNYGELIIPARPLAAFSMPSLDGDAITETYLLGRWTLVFIGSAECDALCQTSLYNIRQLRLALNEKMDRVQRLWLLAEAGSNQPLPALLNEHSGLKVAQPDAATLASLLAQFKSEDASVSVTGRLYLVDPQGNLMMRYPADANPKGILKDIQRLLKTSWVG